MARCVSAVASTAHTGEQAAALSPVGAPRRRRGALPRLVPSSPSSWPPSR